MIDFKYDFCILGGDLRQTHLAEILIEEGYQVVSYHMKDEKRLEGIHLADSLEEGVAASKNILLPIPFAPKNQIILHEDGQGEDMMISNLIHSLRSGQRIFGGCLSEELIHHCEDISVSYCDFMLEDSVAIYNTVATAEGIIAQAILSHPKNLQDSRCLVIGYGKCGKTLAKKLKAMDSQVYVAARSNEQLSWAKADGCMPVLLDEIEKYLLDLDIIFNTVPSQVLSGQLLKLIPVQTYIMDIASLPGGLDLEEAKRLGLHAGMYSGLPGKCAPVSSAVVLLECILKIIKKEV
jgi:dipicolinate synthase subunit A